MARPRKTQRPRPFTAVERKWHNCSLAEMFRMLTYKRVRTKVTDRKFRLFASACCRCCWDLLTDERSRTAIEVAEKYADGQVLAADLLKAHLGAHTAVWGTRDGTRNTMQQRRAAIAVSHLTLLRETPYYEPGALRHFTFDNGPIIATLTKHATWKQIGWQEDSKLQLLLLRDIFGNPFQRMKIDPGWQTSTVVSLAQGIYAEGAFYRLAILGDALEDAGCTKIDILSHCRNGGEHVRGCWLVDLLLDKE